MGTETDTKSGSSTTGYVFRTGNPARPFEILTEAQAVSRWVKECRQKAERETWNGNGNAYDWD